jgi:predicted transcriptional regulator
MSTPMSPRKLDHQVMVRVSDALYLEAQKLADKEDRPLSYLIRRGLEREVQRLRKKGAK